MTKATALALGLLVAATQASAQQRYTCESTAALPGFGHKLRLVLKVPDEKVLGEARLTLALKDRERRDVEHLSDPLRTAAGTLSVQIGKQHVYQFVILNYPSKVLPPDASNSLRGIAIDSQTSTALSLSVFSGQAGLEFVAFDHLLAPTTLIRGRCDAT